MRANKFKLLLAATSCAALLAGVAAEDARASSSSSSSSSSSLSSLEECSTPLSRSTNSDDSGSKKKDKASSVKSKKKREHVSKTPLDELRYAAEGIKVEGIDYGRLNNFAVSSPNSPVNKPDDRKRKRKNNSKRVSKSSEANTIEDEANTINYLEKAVSALPQDALDAFCQVDSRSRKSKSKRKNNGTRAPKSSKANIEELRKAANALPKEMHDVIAALSQVDESSDGKRERKRKNNNTRMTSHKTLSNIEIDIADAEAELDKLFPELNNKKGENITDANENSATATNCDGKDEDPLSSEEIQAFLAELEKLDGEGTKVITNALELLNNEELKNTIRGITNVSKLVSLFSNLEKDKDKEPMSNEKLMNTIRVITNVSNLVEKFNNPNSFAVQS
ncbi:MAG: hypothetical protein ABFQ95_05405 [Pseudomonadota bacterium]